MNLVSEIKFCLDLWEAAFNTQNLKHIKKINNYIMDYLEKLNYAETQEFITPKRIKILSFKRIKGEVIGTTFVDKYGFTNRLIFWDYDQNKERIIDISSIFFAFDFRNGGVKNGETCLALTTLLKDEREGGKSYRRWIFQKISEIIEPIQKVVEQITTDERININNTRQPQSPPTLDQRADEGHIRNPAESELGVDIDD